MGEVDLKYQSCTLEGYSRLGLIRKAIKKLMKEPNVKNDAKEEVKQEKVTKDQAKVFGISKWQYNYIKQCP